MPYGLLGKLAEEGMAEKVAVTKEGNRPSRTIFRITKAGQAEFLRLLRECWETVEGERYSIDVGVAFMDALPRSEIRESLRGRAARLEQTHEYLLRHEREQLKNPHVPAKARFIFSHSSLHIRAELQWTRDLLDGLERGEL